MLAGCVLAGWVLIGWLADWPADWLLRSHCALMRAPTAHARSALRRAAVAAPSRLHHAPKASPRVPATLHVHSDPMYDALKKQSKCMSLKMMEMESRRGGGAATPDEQRRARE